MVTHFKRFLVNDNYALLHYLNVINQLTGFLMAKEIRIILVINGIHS
jgi:hypothetical protein